MRRAQDRAQNATIKSRALGALKLASKASCARSALRECARETGRFFLLHFSHYYYILNNIHSLPLINISRERTNFDAWGYWRFYSRYYRGRAYSLTNAWKLDFLPWNWCRIHVLSTRVVRKNSLKMIGVLQDVKKDVLFHVKKDKHAAKDWMIRLIYVTKITFFTWDVLALENYQIQTKYTKM